MRKLSFDDIFKAANIVKKLGLKDELKKMSESIQKGKIDRTSFGFDFLFMLMDNATTEEMRDLVADFCAGPLGITADDFRNGDVLAYLEQLTSPEIASLEDWANFFTRVKSSLRR